MHSHRIGNCYTFTTFIPDLKTVQACACAFVHNCSIILVHYAQCTVGNTVWIQLFLINETPAQATAGQLLGPHFGISRVTLHWQGCK